MPFVSRDDVRIWWSSSGAGDPVLLLNDLGSSSDVWFRLVRQISSSCRLIAVDNRGTGRTGVTPGGPYRIETMAADAIAALDAAGVEQAHVLGFSMGGLIAQEIALSFPDRTRSLVLAATHAGFRHAVPMAAEVAEQISRAARLPAEDRADELAGLFYASSTLRSEITVDDAVHRAWPTSSAGYRNQFRGAMGWGRFDDLRQVAVPTLVLAGENDLVVPPENSRILADSISGARIRVLSEAGHQVFTDQEVFAAGEVLEFVRGVVKPAPVRASVRQVRSLVRTIASA